MPKADPRDWDRLFHPRARRRGGPLTVFAILLLTGVLLVLLSGTAYLALLRIGQARELAATQAVQATTAAANVFSQRTATAQAEATATAAALAAATPTVAPEVLIGRSSVLNDANLRSEPVVSDETVIGQICAGDQVDVIEQRTVETGDLWYRIRLTQASANCSPQRVSLGSIGWTSATLLSPPAP